MMWVGEIPWGRIPASNCRGRIRGTLQYSYNISTCQNASKMGTHRAIVNSLIVIASWMAISIFTPISAKLSLAETAAQQQTQVVRYSNTWAVEVRGGAEEADALAQKHGLINRGQVKTFVNTTDSDLLLLCRLVINNTTTCS